LLKNVLAEAEVLLLRLRVMIKPHLSQGEE